MGQVKVGSANFEDIVVDGKPIYDDDEVQIYYADTPQACVQYKQKVFEKGEGKFTKYGSE